MRLFNAWMRLVDGGEVPDRKETRLAFQAGARYALEEMADSLRDFDTSIDTVMRVGDEILDFTRVARLGDGKP